MKLTLITISLFLIGLIKLTAQEWITNFDEALTLSKESKKPIILVFQGSDWCAPCMKLEKEIWNNSEFQSYAKDHFVMLLADFPRRKQNALSKEQSEANATLAEKYNKQGAFPMVVKLNSQGEVIGKTGYNKMTPKDYIDHLEKL